MPLSKTLLKLAAALSLCSSAVSAATVAVEPDSYAPGTDLSTAVAGLTLSVVGVGYGHSGSGIYSTPVAGSSVASTGTQVFGTNGGGFPYLFREDGFLNLRGDFSMAVYSVSLDFVSDIGDPSDIGLLRAYDAANNLLGSVTSGVLANGAFATLSFSSLTPIAYFLAGGDTAFSALSIDKLSFDTGSTVPAPGSLALLGAGLLGLGALRRRVA